MSHFKKNILKHESHDGHVSIVKIVFLNLTNPSTLQIENDLIALWKSVTPATLRPDNYVGQSKVKHFLGWGTVKFLECK